MTTPQPPEHVPPATESAPPPGAPGPTAADGWPATTGPAGNAAGSGAAEPAAGRGARPFLIGGVAGALVGALVVGICWAASSFVAGGDGAGASADAAAACGVFQRVPENWKAETVTEANTYQLGGAIALAQAAGRQDQEYAALAAQARQVQQAVVTLNFGQVAQLVTDVRNTCAEL
ncbi:MAG TPA: hypothetical protein VFG35_06895 [Actinoplanes sp.]|nr:hypothetical protein [Actinoplanes sp.]